MQRCGPFAAILDACAAVATAAAALATSIAPLLGSVALALSLSSAANAADAATYKKLLSDDFADKREAIEEMLAAPDAATAMLVKALLDGSLHVTEDGRPLISAGGGLRDALTGTPADGVSPAPEQVMISNRLRIQLQAALASLQLTSPDPALRLSAATELQQSIDDDLVPAVERAIAAEADVRIKELLALALASVRIRSAEPSLRLDAVRLLSNSDHPQVRNLLLKLLEKNTDGSFVEPDESVREAARISLRAVESRMARAEWIGHVFAGLSLGSVLMLAAIGLAITYGLLGVINMAHGEMIMIGAYAAYVTQSLFRSLAPELFGWYPLAALPIAFAAAGAVGVFLERTVIRWLYGRPLETLLATWGISLVLIQSVRQIFGPQNVEIENPAWLSGGVSFANSVLPYNRIVIIAFSLFVLAIVALVLVRTRLGLFVRGVTQNRPMAAAIGVPTARVDMLAFGLGSGIAGLAGVALSQIGNVGPDLGQAYIIDSFIVVVLGGVGQIAGTVLAGFGLGIANKMLEPWAGAVIAKIAILVLVIAFIQKRPQGLFALKGRAVEA